MGVGYPDGGVRNPMALSFVPRAGLQAGRLTSALPVSATSQGSWLQQRQPPSASRPASDVDLCFMTVRPFKPRGSEDKVAYTSTCLFFLKAPPWFAGG